MSILLEESCVLDVLNKYGGGVIKSGGHNAPDWFNSFNGSEEPPGTCEMCVEELRSVALFLCANRSRSFTDHPEGDGPFEAMCRSWNDAVKSDELRTSIGIRLACRSTETAELGWQRRYLDRFCREVLSNVFDTVAEVVTKKHKQPMRDAVENFRANGIKSATAAAAAADVAAAAVADAGDAADAVADAVAAAIAAAVSAVSAVADATFACATYAYAAAASAVAASAVASAAYATSATSAYAASAVASAASATSATSATSAYAAHNKIMEQCALILIECHDGTGLVA